MEGMVMIERFSVFGSTLAFVVLSWSATPATAQPTVDPGRLRQEALELTNAARVEEGVPELALDAILNEAAESHAADMLARNFYAHVAPNGETPRDRFRASGGDRWAVSGENIATCSGCTAPPDPARVRAFHTGWMQSPGHRANILSPGFDAFGFAIAGEGERIYAVQTFSGPGTSETEDGETRPIPPKAARSAALDEVNRVRADAGLDALAPNEALDTLAGRVLDAVTAGEEALPEDLFGLLPEGSSGWTNLAVRTADRSGAGPEVVRGDVTRFVAGWTASAAEAEALGGTAASDLGFVIRADGHGRKTAIAVFGGR